MATIINTPPGQTDSGNSASIWVGGLIVIVLIVLFAMFVWPKFMNANQQTAVPVNNGSNAAMDPSTTNNYNTTINSTSTNTTVEASTTLPI